LEKSRTAKDGDENLGNESRSIGTVWEEGEKRDYLFVGKVNESGTR